MSQSYFWKFLINKKQIYSFLMFFITLYMSTFSSLIFLLHKRILHILYHEYVGNIFAGYRFLGWQLLFHYFKDVAHFLLTCIVSDKKSAILLLFLSM